MVELTFKVSAKAIAPAVEIPQSESLTSVTKLLFARALARLTACSSA